MCVCVCVCVLEALLPLSCCGRAAPTHVAPWRHRPRRCVARAVAAEASSGNCHRGAGNPRPGAQGKGGGELLVRSGPSTELCSPNWCHDALCVWDRRRSLLSSAVALSVATPSSPTRSCTWARSSVGRAACFAPCGPCTSFMSVASRAWRVATRTSHVRSWLSVTATQTGRRWRTLSSRTCNVPTCSRCVYVRVYVRIPLIMLVACIDT